MKLSSWVLMFLVVVITGCSSAPALPETWKLGTTSKSQNYYYCESCPQPTKLTNQVYQPLEPDEPLVVVKPVAEPTPVTKAPVIKITKTPKRRYITKKHNHKRKQTQVQTKQCIKWSN